MSFMHLSDPLSSKLLRSTQAYINALQAIGRQTVEDLLLILPRAYEDLSSLQTLESAREGEKISVRGTIGDLKLVHTRHGKRFVRAMFVDTEGEVCEVIWFNQPHIMRMLSEGSDLVLTGKFVVKGKKLILQSPTFETGDRELLHSGRIVPIYQQHTSSSIPVQHTPSGSAQVQISTRWLREKMAIVKNAIEEFQETLPRALIQEEGLLSRSAAIREQHFPTSKEALMKARERMAFEELFKLQKQALERKKEWQSSAQKRLAIPMNVELIRAFFSSLNFTPTKSQRIAIYEILKDLEKPVPMSRLLEGDVGSGKTLVATAVMANVVYYGGQCALMVPTEVLAKQHAVSISKLLKKTSIALLTGSTPEKESLRIKLGLATGTIDIVIGTHTLIQSDVLFKDLRLAIVDEQHRFGVEQRKTLKENGSPHFLSMTATPIPRTLALTAYGDHDLSVLLEKPGNRKPIKTKVVPPRERRTVELFIDREITSGRQAYVICPLIRESEELDEVRNVLHETKRLQEEFPRRRIASLHGQLTSHEKDAIMLAFQKRETDILVSTSVIEVGIDVPNVSVILIEGAERFGLSQLHQLRGRVGRADHQSYCFLSTTEQSQARSSDRLKAMERFSNGFHLAEIDLKLRGPGELYGTRQSGLPEIRVSALTNPEFVMRVRKAAEKFLGLTKGVREKNYTHTGTGIS